MTKRRKGLRRLEWAAAVGLVVATLVSGYWGTGQMEVSRGTASSTGAPGEPAEPVETGVESADPGLSFSDRLYLTVQLFVLESNEVGGVPRPFNWARWLAVIVAGWATVRAILLIFSTRIHRWRAARSRGHAVVFGNEGMVVRLIQDLREAGEGVVYLAKDRTGFSASKARGLGAFVVEGDPTDADALRSAGVPRARNLVALADEDAVNAEAVIRSKALQGGGRVGTFHAFARIKEPGLCRMLTGRGLEEVSPARVQLEFFDFETVAAIRLLDAYPPFRNQAFAGCSLGGVWRKYPPPGFNWSSSISRPLPRSGFSTLIRPSPRAFPSKSGMESPLRVRGSGRNRSETT
jgi:voltage-gated potassium channel Kch